MAKIIKISLYFSIGSYMIQVDKFHHVMYLLFINCQTLQFRQGTAIIDLHPDDPG